MWDKLSFSCVLGSLSCSRAPPPLWEQRVSGVHGCAHLWGLQYNREGGKLEQVQLRKTRCLRGLIAAERELRGLFLPEQEKAEGELVQPRGWLERDGAKFGHPPKLQQGKFRVIIRKLLSPEGGQMLEQVAQRDWNLHPERFSELVWTSPEWPDLTLKID